MGFHQRGKCVENATIIKHKTEVHDIITIDKCISLIKDDRPLQAFLQLYQIKDFNIKAQSKLLHAANTVCMDDFENLYTRCLVIFHI